MARIAVLEQFSGRNMGDTASLDVIMSEIAEIDPSAKFDLYSVLNPDIKAYFPEHHSAITRVDMMPWNLSLNFMGLPVLLNLRRCDWILIRGGVFFDKKLWNPVFSYLLNFRFILPYAKMLGKPVVLYGVGVGPLNTGFGRSVMRKVLRCVSIMTTRDQDSLTLAQSIGGVPPHRALAADPALRMKLAPISRAKEICDKYEIDLNKPLIGINVNSFVDFMVQKGGASMNTASFISIVAKIADRLIDNLDVNIVLVPTDIEGKIFDQIRNIVRHRQRVHYIPKENHLPNEIAAVISQFELFIGMRMHSLIFASAAHTPMVGIVYNKKVASFFNELNIPEATVSFDNFTEDAVYRKISEIWNKRDIYKEKVIKGVRNLAERELVTSKLVRKFIYG
ncbi:polysaccharide pyruvyl transferase family protein [Desulfonema magnum]|uniref:Polysaccharide pyruyl transferase n=1 Tax=Desulfonema magnum TaxID=45655 RepID=A0A975BHX6_9BACT|nr:polysaccharide pyruvyl transferase family protein [Desulfonema magnum]QTA85613.1 Putative polysaccharide pyruyl transferase [Desulfonema magnum]